MDKTLRERIIALVKLAQDWQGDNIDALVFTHEKEITELLDSHTSQALREFCEELTTNYDTPGFEMLTGAERMSAALETTLASHLQKDG